MFVLMWAILFFSVRGSNADTGPSVEGRKLCEGEFCITLNEGEITAEAGLCVVIPCSFTTGSRFTPQHIIWYKCEQSKQRCGDSDVIFHTNKNNKKGHSGFKGRVSLLEPDVSLNNCGIIINDLTESDSGSYQLRVNGHLNGWSDGFTFSPRATVSVKDLIQKPTVMIPPLTEGQQTTLTCTAPGLCSGSDPKITWTWRGAGEKDSHITGNITAFKTENMTAVTQRHSSTLTFNPSSEHHGTKVTCKVTGNTTTEETVTLTVTLYPKILTSSKCEVQSEVLTCVCVSEGLPLPTIKWLLLETYTEYSVFSTVSNHTVKSNITVSVKGRNYTTVECASSNKIGEAKENFTIIINEIKQEDLLKKLLITVKQPQVIIAFLIGILLSAIICFLAGKCHRKKQKSPGTLETVTTQAVPLIDAGEAVENDGTHDQEAAEGGAEAAGQSAPDGDVEPKEVEYSDLDFSLLKRKSPMGAEDTQETTETEYAEIKREETEERQDDGGKDGEMLEGKEEVVQTGEEIKQCVPAEQEEGEDVALYSNVNEIMGEI